MKYILVPFVLLMIPFALVAVAFDIAKAFVEIKAEAKWGDKK